MIRANRAYLVIEYAVMIGIVVAALMVGMQTYIKRGIQGVIKTSADDLGSVAEEYHQSIGSKLVGVDSQILGAMEPGLVNYEMEQPVEVRTEQNITLTESPPGGGEPMRQKTINTTTTTTGKWNVVHRLGKQDLFSASEKTDKPEAEAVGGGGEPTHYAY